MITPASPPNAIIITKLPWPDMKGNFILITYIFSYMKYPEPGCFSQQLWLIGTHRNPSALYEHKSQSRRPRHKTKRRRNESPPPPPSAFWQSSFMPARMLPHQTTQRGRRLINFNLARILNTFSSFLFFPNEKKQDLKLVEQFLVTTLTFQRYFLI